MSKSLYIWSGIEKAFKVVVAVIACAYRTQASDSPANLISDTKFSHGRGFYQTNFSLVIFCATPGANIYYTTNGSLPSATNGLIFTAPIPVARTSTIRARAEKTGFSPSNVDTHTYLFLKDILTQSSNGTAPPGWPSKWGDNKVDYGMDPDIVTKAPWSGTISNDLRSIPSLSLVMRLEDLFNARTGIYANPGGEGREWERACSLELIYPDGKPGFQVRAGVRIRGGFSRDTANPKHSFRFVMRSEYGDAKLHFPFFGSSGADTIDRFDLRTPQDNSWAFQGDANGLFLPDSFARDTLLALGQPGERGDWYHLYINGVYWGLYNSCERPEANFGASYLGGVTEDWDALKPDPQQGYHMKVIDGNDQAWLRLWKAATNGFASNANYFRVQGRNPDGTFNPAFENLLDVTNLIDFLLTIFWSGDVDGPICGDLNDGFLNNFYAIRNRTGQSGGFRFITHDAEMSLYSVDENRIGTSSIGDPSQGDDAERLNPYYLWTKLLPNPEFKTLVADRIQKHFFHGGALTREACTARFVARTNEIYHALTGEAARWGDAQHATSPITPKDWRDAVQDKMENYFPFRAQNVLDQLRDAGLFPALSAPALSQESGEVPTGFAVTLSHTNPGGEVFFTMDGSDPRAIGGGISNDAMNYDLPIIIKRSTVVRARVKDGSTWSPIIEGSYYPAQDFSGLRITEINYNPLPSGVIDGDEFEFIELKNSGNTAIDLGGAYFTGFTFTFPSGAQLAPGTFFLLGRSAANFATRYPGVALDAVYAGKLDNSGEKIALMSPAGVEILSVSYKDRAPWPVTPDGHGFTLVPLNPDMPSDTTAWRASSALNGSPGRDDPVPTIPEIVINEVLTHTDLPQLDEIELFNPTAVSADISGWYLSDNAGLPQKFNVPVGTFVPPGGYVVFTEADFNKGLNAFSLNSEGDEVYLFSGDGLGLTGYSHGFAFGPAAKGVSFARYLNSVGEELFPPQMKVTSGAVNVGPLIGPAVMNEIHYHPLTNYDEYIEVLNITDAPLALYDAAYPTNVWRINGVGFEFPMGTTLPPHGFALISGGDPAVFRSRYDVPADVPIFPLPGKLQDSGERLELQRPDSPGTNGVVPFITVDELRYNDRAPWPAAADGDGPALQRLDSNGFANEPTNWFASGLTPGRPNHFNHLPSVSLATVGGTDFTLPTSIMLEATATDSDGSITLVEFFDGATKIGEATAAPYRIIWQTPASGSRHLIAKARDNELGSATSAPFDITVRPPVLGSGFGLRAEYYNDPAFGALPVKRVDPNIDFTWTDEPMPGISADGFSVRWTGRIQSLANGTFTFYTRSTDGVRLWVGGKLLISNWTDHAETEDSATMALDAGQLYELKLEYYNASGSARIQLAWSAPGLQKTAIPRAQFYPPVNVLNQPPVILIASPTDNSGLPPGNLALVVSTSDPDGAVQKVRYFADGALLGESANPPFSFTWANPTRGSHALSAIAIDDNLGAATSRPVTVHIVNGYRTNETLIASGATWRYWDRGGLPAMNWNVLSFDDRAWNSGPAQLGYGDGDEATVVGYGPDANNKFITTYFRKSFVVTSPETVSALTLRIIRDDGPAVYLNGQEIFRDNLPNGPLDYDTLALNAFGAPEENTPIAATIPGSTLVNGSNILSCELHQGAPESSDISFELELTAVRSLLAPYIIAQPESVNLSAGNAVRLSVNAVGAPPLAYQWYHNGLLIRDANSSILNLPGLTEEVPGEYRAVIANALGSATSMVARITLDSTPPNYVPVTIQSASGAAHLTLQTAANKTYRLESTTTLSPPTWLPATTFPALPDATTRDLMVVTNSSTRFFRVVIE